MSRKFKMPATVYCTEVGKRFNFEGRLCSKLLKIGPGTMLINETLMKLKHKTTQNLLY